jgi:hypothetical protein
VLPAPCSRSRRRVVSFGRCAHEIVQNYGDAGQFGLAGKGGAAIEVGVAGEVEKIDTNRS